jgi:membrane protease YdiL (CAAX protease family)
VSGNNSAAGSPGWKLGLALVSLALSLLLWLNGLLDSLHRPSVGNALNLRQLELTVLAEPSLRPPLRQWLAAGDPLGALSKALTEQMQQDAEAGRAAPAGLVLEQALVQARQGQLESAKATLNTLGSSGGSLQRLAEGLATPGSLSAAELSDLLKGVNGSSLVRQWSCEAALGANRCDRTGSAQKATKQLLAVTLVPGLGLLLGLALLVRELWLRWRGRSAAPAPWQGPALSGVDVVLLVAGGFVVVGELLTPLLVGPLLSALLNGLSLNPALKQGLTVVGLYGALMAGPLLILRWMLGSLGPAPEGGWLQFHWWPTGLNLRAAGKGFLMVLPLVSFTGWLQGKVFGDPGGSNPLLELVLNSHNIPALACFGLTAIVLAPLFEETIFRGVLLPVAARHLGSGWGILLSAAVFAVAHLSLGEFPPLLVLGLGLGWLRWRSGRLASCVWMHALWNSLTFLNLVVLGW